MGRALCVKRGPFSVGVEGKKLSTTMISQAAMQETRGFDIKSRVGYKMEQISADFHLISSCNRRMAVQLPL
jgi:hypothetical protein